MTMTHLEFPHDSNVAMDQKGKGSTLYFNYGKSIILKDSGWNETINGIYKKKKRTAL